MGYLTKTTGAAGKIVNYYYDSYYRQTKVSAGSSGTFYPTTLKIFNAASAVPWWRKISRKEAKAQRGKMWR